MLGEYGAQADIGAAGVMEKVAAIAERRSLSDTVRGYMLTAVAKLVAQARLSAVNPENCHCYMNAAERLIIFLYMSIDDILCQIA